MAEITDWLMVGITLVYVIATIAICVANIKSAKSTHEQLSESKHQFEETNRAFISHEFIYENRAFYGLRFTNHGKRVANHVSIVLDDAFIESIQHPQFAESLKRLQGKEFTLGINQSYDIFFGDNSFRDNPKQPPIQGNILYCDSRAKYSEPFYIDFINYPPIFSVETASEKALKIKKDEVKELKNISKNLSVIGNALYQEKNNE